MKIVAHCLVKNEEKFIWYALNSVIDYVDEILVWDNGSSDKSKSVIQSISNSKIKYARVLGPAAKVRQKMLEATEADWILLLDGDEIWFDSSIKYLVSSIQSNFDCVVVPNYMLIGDIFHYQEEKAGRYQIAGKKGHYNIRAIRFTPGLKVKGTFPNEAYVTGQGVKVQDLPEERILFLNTPYLHTSFLKRRKYELGEEFPKDFFYPEVFFKDRPKLVPSPWQTMKAGYKFRAMLETPVKKLKRRLI